MKTDIRNNVQLLVGLIVLSNSKSVIVDICTKSDISFFSLLTLPDGGFLFDPKAEQSESDPFLSSLDCTLHQGAFCKFQTMRSYLPSKKIIAENLKHMNCDEIFSNNLELWLKSMNAINKPGIPYNRWDDKKSIGKYIRYNTYMAYANFTGVHGDNLIDISYNSEPLGWPWADSVPFCTGEYANWNCAFNHSQTYSTWNQKMESKQFKLADDINIDEVFKYRNTLSNHSIQLLLFGKFVTIMTEPNKFIQDFLISNLVSLNDHIWTERFDSDFHSIQTHEVQTKKLFLSSYSEFLEYVSNYHSSSATDTGTVLLESSLDKSTAFYTTISMHVRRGDACDLEYNHEVDLEKELLVKFKRDKNGNPWPSRPCFTIDLYMKKLHLMRKTYNAIRVFLATDSVEMIKRTYSEPHFNWVFVHNPEISNLDRKGWIEKRGDGENEGILKSTVSDLTLLRYGDIFLGAFSSQYSKIAYFMMAGQQQRIPPFLSLDTSMACEIHFNCSIGLLSSLNMTMFDIFQLDDYRIHDGSRGQYGQGATKARRFRGRRLSLVVGKLQQLSVQNSVSDMNLSILKLGGGFLTIFAILIPFVFAGFRSRGNRR